MSENLLFMSLSCLSILYVENLYADGLLLILYMLYFLRHFRRGHFFFLVLLLYSVTLNALHEVPEAPDFDTVRITEIHSSYAIGEGDGQDIMLYGVEDVNFDDVISIEGSFQRIEGITNEGEFQFSRWAERKGMYYAMQVERYTVLSEGKTLRHKLYGSFKTDDTAFGAWMRMMLFQISDNENVSAMAFSSGMHIQLLMKWIKSFCTLFMQVTTANMLTLLMAGFLGSISVMTMSLQRVLCTGIISLLFPHFSLQDRLGLEILFWIFWMPSVRYELAFVLPLLFRLLFLFNVHHIHKKLLSLLLLIPIQLYFYQTLDIVQMILFPLFRSVYAICYAVAWLSVVLPFLQLPYLCAQSCQEALYRFSEACMKVYFLPGTIWMLLWSSALFRYLNAKETKTLLSFLILLLYIPMRTYVNPFTRIIMMDVGLGDSTLFILPFHQGALLLDAAGNLYKNIPEDILVPMMRKRGIDNLDMVVLTHDDYDHSGGMNDLQKLMEIGEIVTDKRDYLELGEVRFDMPLSDEIYDNANDNSIILFLDLYGYRMLFMGDAGHVSEQDLLLQYPKLKADILKVGHHGSKNSSLPAFLHQLDPQVALISCGRHNRYGHPDPSVMKTLDNENIHPLITAEQGSVTLYFSKFISFYKTASGEFGIIKHR